MSTHTPGQWEAEIGSRVENAFVLSGETYVAKCYACDEAADNARLMAASKELLAAAKEITEAVFEDYNDWHIQSAAVKLSKAIAKAEGTNGQE